MSGRDQSRCPCWNKKSNSERFPCPYEQLSNTQFEINERKIGRDPAHSMVPSPYSPDIAPSDFCFSGRAKKRWRDKPSRVERRSKHSSSKCGQEWIPVNFSAYLMNEWRGLNMLSNQEESTILNKNASLWLLAYSSHSTGGHLRFVHPIWISMKSGAWGDGKGTGNFLSTLYTYLHPGSDSALWQRPLEHIELFLCATSWFVSTLRLAPVFSFDNSGTIMAKKWSWFNFCSRWRTSKTRSFVPLKTMVTMALFIVNVVSVLGGPFRRGFPSRWADWSRYEN
jgi:hypothetical protein